MVFLAYVHLAFLALSLFLQATLLFPHGVTIACYSFLALTVSNSSLFTAALLRTHSFIFFAVQETRCCAKRVGRAIRRGGGGGGPVQRSASPPDVKL